MNTKGVKRPRIKRPTKDVKHPIKEIQDKQEDFLKNRCPADEIEYHASFFRLGNASYIYHQLAKETSPEQMESYYCDWLNELPPSISAEMKKRGFEECTTVLPFTRYVNERNGIGMDEWMKQRLSNADYRRYKQ